MTEASQGQLTQIALLFAVFAFWLFGPLLPAILIHRLLPDNKINVAGPLQGLKVNASGGIASYILLLLMFGAAVQARLIPAINRLDDGGWQFQIPFVVQDADGNRLVLAGGSKVTVDVVDNPNPDFRMGGVEGYEATFRATRINGKLPTVRLVGHLMGGATAQSQPIDLERLASDSSSDERIVRAPRRALRANQDLSE